MKRYSLTLQSVLMMSALAACGQGTFIYDQSSATNRSIDFGAPIQQQQPIGQSFTPTLSSVGFVQFEFDDPLPGNGTGATVYVNLRSDSLTGTILGSTDPVAMPDGFDYGITNFFFPAAVAVTPGSTYYFQPVVQSGESLWGIINGPYNYPGGMFFASGVANPNGYDAWFREGALTPEPSSALLVLAGIAGLYAARRLRKLRAGRLLLIFATFAVVGTCSSSAEPSQTNWGMGYFSMLHQDWPPLISPPPGCAVFPLPGQPGLYEFNDLDFDYAAWQAAQESAQPSLSARRAGSPAPDGPSPLDDGTNLHLQITLADATDVSVLATNVQWDQYLQLLTKTDLVKQVVWTPEQETSLDAGGPNDYVFTVPENGRPAVFFWAAEADTHVWVVAEANAIQSGPCYTEQPGVFNVYREQFAADYSSRLTVTYRISGTATNGVNYTFLDGSVTFPEQEFLAQIKVYPVASLVTSNLTVTATLLITNGYLPSPEGPSATILIEPNFFGLVATNILNPIGLDYHTLTDSLLVGVDPFFAGGTNFVRIDAWGNVSHWADVTNLIYPTPLTTVKATANGFDEGATYFCGFGSSTLNVGWLSPTGDASIKEWVLLDEYAWGLGGLYVDQSGTWGGDLIVTTGGDAQSDYQFGGGVWRITSDGVATQVVYLATCLGGVITLTNDPAQWGPWAGKIITGQDYEEYPEFPEIYAIDTAGQVLTNATLGIQPEQINLIPPNQSFYFCDTDTNAVWQVPYTAFTNHVGQLLMTGPGDSVHRPALYVVHYDAGGTNQFVAEQIDLPEFIGRLEQGAFAPLTNMPCLDH